MKMLERQLSGSFSNTISIKFKQKSYAWPAYCKMGLYHDDEACNDSTCIIRTTCKELFCFVFTGFGAVTRKGDIAHNMQDLDLVSFLELSE